MSQRKFNIKESRIKEFRLSGLDHTKATWLEIYKGIIETIINEDVLNDLVFEGESLENVDLLNSRTSQQFKIMLDALTSLIKEFEDLKSN